MRGVSTTNDEYQSSSIIGARRERRIREISTDDEYLPSSRKKAAKVILNRKK